jgi:hypothetical protein
LWRDVVEELMDVQRELETIELEKGATGLNSMLLNVCLFLFNILYIFSGLGFNIVGGCGDFAFCTATVHIKSICNLNQKPIIF